MRKKLDKLREVKARLRSLDEQRDFDSYLVGALSTSVPEDAWDHCLAVAEDIVNKDRETREEVRRYGEEETRVAAGAL